MCRKLGERHSIETRKQLNLAEEPRITQVIRRQTRGDTIASAVSGLPC
jgi:hypothetical protein